MTPKSEEITEVRERLDKHDERLRKVESFIEILPRIESKLDGLVKANHGETIAVMLEQAKGRDRDIKALKERADQTTEKFWKVAIVIALILGALQGIGVDLTSMIPGGGNPVEIVGNP